MDGEEEDDGSVTAFIWFVCSELGAERPAGAPADGCAEIHSGQAAGVKTERRVAPPEPPQAAPTSGEVTLLFLRTKPPQTLTAAAPTPPRSGGGANGPSSRGGKTTTRLRFLSPLCRHSDSAPSSTCQQRHAPEACSRTSRRRERLRLR